MSGVNFTVISDDYSNHNLPIGAEVTEVSLLDVEPWQRGATWYTMGGEGDEVAIDFRDLKVTDSHFNNYAGYYVVMLDGREFAKFAPSYFWSDFLNSDFYRNTDGISYGWVSKDSGEAL